MKARRERASTGPRAPARRRDHRSTLGRELARHRALGNGALARGGASAPVVTGSTDLGGALDALGRTVPPGVRSSRLVLDSALPDAHGVAGATAAGAVHLGSRAESLSATGLADLLAHESAHVAQAREGRRPAGRHEIEMEAHDLVDAHQRGSAPRPELTPRDAVHLQTPRDTALVERARARAELLEAFIAEYYTRRVRRSRIAAESGALQSTRVAIDDAFGFRKRQIEEIHFRRMNRRPLRVEVTEDAVRFLVRFHVRFEGLGRRAARRQLPLLERSFNEGVRRVWNQTLSGTALLGRRFEVVPTFELIGRHAKRNPDYWLITVRPTDTAPMEYEGTSLGDAPGGTPTSATNPLVGEGVMSVPPSHIAKPDVLAHELLHSFGLIDRYLITESVSPEGERTVATQPTRATPGRSDPLGGEYGKVLVEDLDLLFARHGVYAAEETRGLDTLRRLEASGLMTIAQARVELERQREIIRTGRDPRSLIRPRTDFRDRIRESAEQL